MRQVIQIKLLAGDDEVLSGAIRGMNFLPKLVEELNELGRRTIPEPLFLDFSGIVVATSSYLREAILGFRDYCLRMETNFYPVLANISQQTRDELEVLLVPRGDAFVVCKLNGRGNVSEVEIIGTLEEKQRLTLEAVISAGEADAATLEEQYRDREQIKATGWNNRLAALVSKGILMESRKGRGKTYRPILEFK